MITNIKQTGCEFGSKCKNIKEVTTGLMAAASVVWLCCVWHESFMSCSQGASED